MSHFERTETFDCKWISEDLCVFIFVTSQSPPQTHRHFHSVFKLLFNKIIIINILI